MYESENENPNQGQGKKESRRSSGILKIRRAYLAEMDCEQLQERSEVVVGGKRISRRVSFAERCTVKEFPKDSPQVNKVDNDDTLDLTEDNTADISGLDQLLKGPIKSSDENCQNVSMNSTRLDTVDMDMTSCYGDTSLHQPSSSQPISKHIKSSHFLSNLISGGDVSKKGPGSVLMFDVDDDFCEMTNVINPTVENKNTIFPPDHPASNMEETEVLTINIKHDKLLQDHGINMELTDVVMKNSENNQKLSDGVTETIRFSQTAPEANMVTEETTKHGETGSLGEFTRRFSSGISANMELTCMGGLSLLTTEAEKENVCSRNLSIATEKENLVTSRNLVTSAAATNTSLRCNIVDKENRPITIDGGKDLSMIVNKSIVKETGSSRTETRKNEQFAFNQDFSLDISFSPERDEKYLMKSGKADNSSVKSTTLNNLKMEDCKASLIIDKENQPIALSAALTVSEGNEPKNLNVSTKSKDTETINKRANSQIVFDEDLSFDMSVRNESYLKEVSTNSVKVADELKSGNETRTDSVENKINTRIGNDKANLKSFDTSTLSCSKSTSKETIATKKDDCLFAFDQDFTLEMTNTKNLPDLKIDETENRKKGLDTSTLKMKEGLNTDKNVAMDTRIDDEKELDKSHADKNSKSNHSVNENEELVKSDESGIIKPPIGQTSSVRNLEAPARVENPGLKRRLHSLELTQTEVKVRLKLHGKDLVKNIDTVPLDVSMETQTHGSEVGGKVQILCGEDENNGENVSMVEDKLEEKTVEVTSGKDNTQDDEQTAPENSMAIDIDDEPMPDNLIQTDVTTTTTHDSNHSNSSSLSVFKSDDSGPWSYETFCDKMSINYPASNRARCSLVINEKINLDSLKECLAANVIKTTECQLTQDMINNVEQYILNEKEQIEKMKSEITQKEPQLFRIIREAPERGKLHEDIVEVSRACRRLAKQQWKQFQINKTKCLNDVLKKKCKHLEMAVTEILDQTSEVTNSCALTEQALSEIDGEILRLQKQVEEDVVMVTKHHHRLDEVNKLTEEKRKEHDILEKEKMKLEEELKTKEEKLSKMEKDEQPSNRHDNHFSQLSQYKLRLQHLQALHSWILVEETLSSTRAEFLFFNDSIKLEVDYKTMEDDSVLIQHVEVKSCLPNDSYEWFELGNRFIMENLKARDLSTKYISQKSMPQILDEVSGVVCDVEDLINDIVSVDLLHSVTIEHSTVKFNVLNPVTVKKIEASLTFSYDNIFRPKTQVKVIVGDVNCKDLEEMISKLDGSNIIQKIAKNIKQFIST